jgi:hypothetical protein
LLAKWWVSREFELHENKFRPLPSPGEKNQRQLFHPSQVPFAGLCAVRHLMNMCIFPPAINQMTFTPWTNPEG